MSFRHKAGPQRAYSADELEIFSRHRDERARFRPEECVAGDKCWVERGPPAITGTGYCLGCRRLAGELRKGFGGGRVKVAR